MDGSREGGEQDPRRELYWAPHLPSPQVAACGPGLPSRLGGNRCHRGGPAGKGCTAQTFTFSAGIQPGPRCSRSVLGGVCIEEQPTPKPSDTFPGSRPTLGAASSQVPCLLVALCHPHDGGSQLFSDPRCARCVNSLLSGSMPGTRFPPPPVPVPGWPLGTCLHPLSPASCSVYALGLPGQCLPTFEAWSEMLVSWSAYPAVESCVLAWGCPGASSWPWMRSCWTWSAALCSLVSSPGEWRLCSCGVPGRGWCLSWSLSQPRENIQREAQCGGEARTHLAGQKLAMCPAVCVHCRGLCPQPECRSPKCGLSCL